VNEQTLSDEEKKKEMDFLGTSRTLQPYLWRIQDPISLAVIEITLQNCEHQVLSHKERVGEVDMYMKLLITLHNF
jgi:hypothetical protein